MKVVKKFKHEWILEPFVEHPTFRSKRMFGGLAVYLFERQMLMLIEPTKSGRWKWDGVLICTDHRHHESIQDEFPALKPHDILRKWLFIDSTNGDFENTMGAVADRMATNDPRFGILPKGINISGQSAIGGKAGNRGRPTVSSAHRKIPLKRKSRRQPQTLS